MVSAIHLARGKPALAATRAQRGLDAAGGKAGLRGIEIDELEVRIEGQVDLRGVFEIDSARPALSNISVTVLV
jgi:hypothetical protein